MKLNPSFTIDDVCGFKGLSHLISRDLVLTIIATTVNGQNQIVLIIRLRSHLSLVFPLHFSYSHLVIPSSHSFMFLLVASLLRAKPSINTSLTSKQRADCFLFYLWSERAHWSVALFMFVITLWTAGAHAFPNIAHFSMWLCFCWRGIRGVVRWMFIHHCMSAGSKKGEEFECNAEMAYWGQSLKTTGSSQSQSLSFSSTLFSSWIILILKCINCWKFWVGLLPQSLPRSLWLSKNHDLSENNCVLCHSFWLAAKPSHFICCYFATISCRCECLIGWHHHRSQ